MNATLADKLDYLHDGYVDQISLTIDRSGNRLLTLFVHCHPDCGLDELNGKKVKIEFIEPSVILGELLGNMANAEEINTVDLVAANEVTCRVNYSVNAGMASPKQGASILFQSGSQLQVACREITISETTSE